MLNGLQLASRNYSASRVELLSPPLYFHSLINYLLFKIGNLNGFHHLWLMLFKPEVFWTLKIM